MELKDKVFDQLLKGHGVSVLSENEFARAVGRLQAVEQRDKPAIDALRLTASDALRKAEAAKVELDSIILVAEAPPPPLNPDEPSEEEVIAKEEYENAVRAIKLARLEYQAKVDRHKAVAEKARKAAETLLEKQKNMGPAKQLQRNAAAFVCRDLLRFLENKVGSSIRDEACAQIKHYMDANPSAVLVPIKNFGGIPAQVVDADTLAVVCATQVSLIGAN